MTLAGQLLYRRRWSRRLSAQPARPAATAQGPGQLRLMPDVDDGEEAPGLGAPLCIPAKPFSGSSQSLLPSGSDRPGTTSRVGECLGTLRIKPPAGATATVPLHSRVRG